jgi:lipase maturation factor 1
MKSDIRVAAPPSKPLLIFDGDCNFCKLWIRRWQKMTGEAVNYLPSQDPEIARRFPEIPHERFQTSVQLIENDGLVYSGAEAVFRTLAKTPGRQWPLRAYQNIPGIASITEAAYGFVAGHRALFSRLTRWF